MVPEEVTRAHLEAETPGLLAWSARKGWDIAICPEGLLVVASLRHPRDGGPMLLEADLKGYRVVPPAWQFLDPATGVATRHAFPATGSDSLFHSNAVLCAHWNRLAYAENGGPHGDWGGVTKWLDVVTNTQARTLGDMLATIHHHLQLSPGRLT